MKATAETPGWRSCGARRWAPRSRGSSSLQARTGASPWGTGPRWASTRWATTAGGCSSKTPVESWPANVVTPSPRARPAITRTSRTSSTLRPGVVVVAPGAVALRPGVSRHCLRLEQRPSVLAQSSLLLEQPPSRPGAARRCAWSSPALRPEQSRLRLEAAPLRPRAVVVAPGAAMPSVLAQSPLLLEQLPSVLA